MKLYEITSCFKNFLEDFEDNLMSKEIFDEEITVQNLTCFLCNNLISQFI